MSVKWGRLPEVPFVTVRFTGQKHGQVRARILQSTGLEQQEAAVQFVVLFLSLEKLVWITVKGEKMNYSDLKNIIVLQTIMQLP